MRTLLIAGLLIISGRSWSSSAQANDLPIKCPSGLSENASAAFKSAVAEIFGPMLAKAGLDGVSLEFNRGSFGIIVPLTPAIRDKFHFEQANFGWYDGDSGYIYTGNSDSNAGEELLLLSQQVNLARRQVFLKLMNYFHADFLLEIEPILVLETSTGRISISLDESGPPKPAGVRHNRDVYDSSDQGFAEAFKKESLQVKSLGKPKPVTRRARKHDSQ